MSYLRAWAHLYFPASFLDEEIKGFMQEEGAEFDKDGNVVTDGYRVEMSDGILCLMNDDAYDGEFQDLEPTLKARSIPFDRVTGMEYQIHPCERIFRPAREGEPELDITIYHDGDGFAVAQIEKVRELLPQGVEAIQSYLDELDPPRLNLREWVEKYLKAGNAKGA